MLSDFEVRGLWGYLLAVIAVGMSIVLHMVIAPDWLGSQLIYFLIFPAIVVVGLAAGRGPAVFASIIGAIGVEYFLADPPSELPLDQLTITRTAIVTATGIFVAHIGAQLRLAREKAQDRAIEFEFLSRLVQTSADPFYVINPAEDFRMVYANQAVGTHLARSNKDVLSLHMWDWNPAFTPEVCRELWQRIQTQRAVTFETIHRRKDGQEVPVEVSANLFEHAGRKYFGGVFRDITARNQTEAALRESEFFHRQMLESIPGMVFTCRPDGYCDYLSQQWVDYTGIPMKQHLGSGWSDLLHPQDQPRAIAAWQDAVAGKASYDLEYRVRRHDGRYEWFKTIGTPIHDEAGRIIRWFGVTMNIETLKRAEEELRDSEERYASLFRNNHAVMLLVDPVTGQIEDANPAACNFYGYTREELTAMNVDRINTLPPQQVKSRMEEAKAGIDHQFRFSHRLASGDTREVAVTSGLISVRGKEMLYSLIFDVTAQVEAEQALRESEQRFRTLADNMAQLAWMADGNGNIFWYNRRWLEYTGITQQQMQGSGWQAVQHPDHLTRVITRFAQSIQSGEIWEDTFPMRGSDGGYRWFLTRAVPIRDDDGRISRWFGTNTDITDQLETQEQLEQLMHRLETKNREMELIISIVSHDLRSPLMTIDGFNREIRKNCRMVEQVMTSAGLEGRLGKAACAALHHDIPESTQYIEVAAAAMNDLVVTLVQVARAGFAPVKPQPLDMDELMDNVVSALEFKIHEAQAVLQIEPLPLCYADRTQVAQIFSNLLDNSLKYRDPSRQVQVSVSGYSQGEHSVYVLQDNGMGIDKKEHQKIFDMFERLENKKVGGEGIGLAIVKRFIERNNGSISLQSTPGQGANFTITLPAVRE